MLFAADEPGGALMLGHPFDELLADAHFRTWAQTCQLNEWIQYVGPTYTCRVYMVERPAPWSKT